MTELLEQVSQWHEMYWHDLEVMSSNSEWNDEMGPVDWREIFMKQSVGKCKQINF